ncbi:outer membrane beta-barrel protein [Rufibacter quisquiliarum]|uniref:Opacity protein-like surface antigen n=2 Tax=Rufibacter TaxID=1379908 RepID=A0A839GWC1_9BACT|nr:outer membrane beta-barrel protein [Rufibacter quisquiliarum]MBA9079036.1 opacity protein-like surface antigen [Rufibacter quisquiliarum]
MKTTTFTKGMGFSMLCLLGTLSAPAFAQSADVNAAAAEPAQRSQTILLAHAAPATEPATISYREATSSYKPFAVKRKPKAAFEDGGWALNLGYGVMMEGTKPDGITGPFQVSLDKALGVELGPGVVGLGAEFGYAGYDFGEDDEAATVSLFQISARGTYHYDFLQNDQLDTYAGIGFGYFTSKTTFEDEEVQEMYEEFGDDEDESTTEFTFIIGARYYFTEKFGVYGEFQNNALSRLALGLSVKF